MKRIILAVLLTSAVFVSTSAIAPAQDDGSGAGVLRKHPHTRPGGKAGKFKKHRRHIVKKHGGWKARATSHTKAGSK